jgi:hypothetical protein
MLWKLKKLYYKVEKEYMGKNPTHLFLRNFRKFLRYVRYSNFRIRFGLELK